MDSFFIKHFQSDKTFPANFFLLTGKKSGRELTLLVPIQKLESDVKKKEKKKKSLFRIHINNNMDPDPAF
jgi:hypothetical protein